MAQLKDLLKSLPVKVFHPTWAPGHCVTISHYDSVTEVALGSEMSGDGLTKIPVELDALEQGFTVYSPSAHTGDDVDKYYLWRNKLTGELRAYLPSETPHFLWTQEHWAPFSMSLVIPHVG